MKGPGPLVVTGLLAAALAASVLLLPGTRSDLGPDTLADDGIGPLRLSADFSQAERLAFGLAPDSAFSGLGCSGQDEIRYDTQLGDWPVAVMAMGSDDRILEIEATLHTPTQAGSEQHCLELRDRFAEVFSQRFGPLQDTWRIEKPVSRELLARTGPVVVMARWFPTGRSCYVSAHFGMAKGPPGGEPTRLAGLSALDLTAE